jgi:hypothetical protein
MQTQDFDFAALFAEAAASTETAPQEDYREQLYRDSTFSKKWAATHQEAVKNTVQEYKDAKHNRDTWQAKNYKQNRQTVTVGSDYEERNLSIGAINEKRRTGAIKAYQFTMNEARQTLKDLWLTPAEIAGLID